MQRELPAIALWQTVTVCRTNNTPSWLFSAVTESEEQCQPKGLTSSQRGYLRCLLHMGHVQGMMTQVDGWASHSQGKNFSDLWMSTMLLCMYLNLMLRLLHTLEIGYHASFRKKHLLHGSLCCQGHQADDAYCHMIHSMQQPVIRSVLLHTEGRLSD